MKKKVLNILVVVLTIGVIYEIYSYFNMKPNTKVLEDIKTVDIFDNKDKTLSIMVQDPTTFQYTEDTSRTAWPSREEYMYAGTKCTDKNGTDLGDTTQYISFTETNPNPTVTIKTKKTIYCTLYFAKGRPALEVLKAHDKGANNVVTYTEKNVDGLYRFKGTASQVTNNYICLGEENPDICKTNTENMYRIIGVTTDGKLKVIKASKYGENQIWFSSSEDSRTWNYSQTYTYINGTFYSSLDARIKVLIEYHTWNMDLVSSQPWKPTTTGSQDGTVTNYIGLMSGADYVNAYKDNSTDNWLFIQNGWNGNNAEDEWTMSRYGWYVDTYAAWWVSSGGQLIGNHVFRPPKAVRPVFYLLPTVGLIGEGTVSQPYTVTNIK